jgi:hypothetical protein
MLTAARSRGRRAVRDSAVVLLTAAAAHLVSLVADATAARPDVVTVSALVRAAARTWAVPVVTSGSGYGNDLALKTTSPV